MGRPLLFDMPPHGVGAQALDCSFPAQPKGWTPTSNDTRPRWDANLWWSLRSLWFHSRSLDWKSNVAQSIAKSFYCITDAVLYFKTRTSHVCENLVKNHSPQRVSGRCGFLLAPPEVGIMRIILTFSLLALTSLGAQEVANPGFELELNDWTTVSDRNMSGTTEEAAHSGKVGLRVTDEEDKGGSSLFSLPVEVTPGTKYELSAWARGVSGSGGVGLYLRFLNDQERLVKKEKNVVLPSEGKEWKRYAVSDTAPEGAVMAQVWIHSFTKDTPVVDIDDVELKALPAN
jgi:hypothetical protein